MLAWAWAWAGLAGNTVEWDWGGVTLRSAESGYQLEEEAAWLDGENGDGARRLFLGVNRRGSSIGFGRGGREHICH